MGHIFISYSHKDTTYVEKLEKKLVDEGFDVWVDHRIDYGSRWSKEIEKAIDTCDAYIVVMSKNSAESQWVERERIHAEKRRKPFFPLLLDGEGWFALGNIQFVDVKGGKLPPKDYYEDIARFVTRKAGAAAVGTGVKEVAPIWQKPKLWIAAAIAMGLLVMVGFAIKNALDKRNTGLGGTPMYATATPIDRDPVDPTDIPATDTPTPTQDPNKPPANAQLGDTWTRTTDGMVMSYIPAGEFQMGSEDGDDDEKPVHTVYLDGFWIDQTEVTNAMYAACVETGRCEEPSDRTYLDNSAYANHPVMYVDWEGASNYCEKVGARLPTEAEWEKAARGTDGRTYPWGDGIDCSKASYYDCVSSTTTVGNYKRGVSPYGLYDMVGNAWEWTSTLWKSYPYDATDGREDLGASGLRVLRGGSWNTGYIDTNALRSAYRHWNDPSTESSLNGFRCASETP